VPTFGILKHEACRGCPVRDHALPVHEKLCHFPQRGDAGPKRGCAAREGGAVCGPARAEIRRDSRKPGANPR